MLALAVAAKQPAEASPLPGARCVRSVFLVEPTGTFANDVQAFSQAALLVIDVDHELIVVVEGIEEGTLMR